MAYSRDDEERILIAWATNPSCHSTWRLRTTDFAAPASRFLFDVVKKFSDRHGMIPSAETIGKEVELACSGDSQFTYTTKPDPAVFPAVAELLGRIAQGLPESEIARVADTLPRFLDAVRVAQIARLAAENGWTPGQTVEAMNEAHSDVKAVTGVDPSDVLSSGCEIDLAAMENPEPRVASGIEWLDTGTSGGLVRGNVALLIAPSGVGKTVGMVNFCANANSVGLHSLFMTLENPKEMIRKRWQSIMGYYPIGLYAKPLSTWGEAARNRFKALTSRECIYWDKFAILDKSGRKLITIDGIEAAIRSWKRQNMDRGVPEDKLALVCIDWLKYIDMSSVPGVTKNSRADEPVSLAVQALGNIARRNKVVIWTAQQVTRKAQSKEVLGPEDIADATGIQNYLDLGISLARPVGDLQKRVVTMDGSQGAAAQETSRQLVISCFKSRESSLAGRHDQLYQDPSLRLWRSREACLKTMGRIDCEDPFAHYCAGIAPGGK
jgi:hypothetical protein